VGHHDPPRTASSRLGLVPGAARRLLDQRQRTARCGSGGLSRRERRDARGAPHSGSDPSYGQTRRHGEPANPMVRPRAHGRARLPAFGPGPASARVASACTSTYRSVRPDAAYCDFQHVCTGGGGQAGTGTSTPSSPRSKLAAQVLDPAPAQVGHGVSSAVVRRLCYHPGRPSPGSSTRSTRRGGLAANAEITTEANPESVDPVSLAALKASGFHADFRSACSRPRPACWQFSTAGPHAGSCHRRRAGRAREAGFEHVQPRSDLTETPGRKPPEDFAASLDGGDRSRRRSCQCLRP